MDATFALDGLLCMWCSTCQQETPGVAHSVTGRIVCSRCQQPLLGSKTAPRAHICDEGIALDEQGATASAAASKRLPLPRDDWSHRNQVRKLARELNRPLAAAPRRLPGALNESHRFDPPHPLFGEQEHHVPRPMMNSEAAPASVRELLQSKRTEKRQVFSWLIVSVGSLALAGGIGLMGWSLCEQQMIHWNLAIGLTLGGQGSLIFGLVLVVARLWRNSRYATGKLQEVHTRLGQLQQTADILTTMRAGGSAPGFYAELARGASPHTLLANLKGQLDQLAVRLGG